MCRKLDNSFRWVQRISAELKPCSFVERDYTHKNDKMVKICVKTLEKYMQLLTGKVEK